ncbi:MAG TPA: hypothetical protein DCZ94_12945 [Lentisphaeria bacterium]|nr:MAG: hypothetical protein A2X48_06075 [Lentisphaerae bacterium GWF2_49_21]HBC87855.1 hypothetical protein [Lentisphaeria bacterium]
MNSLAKVKMRRMALLVGVSLLLAGLVIYGVMKPDPEEQEYSRIKNIILSSEPGGNADNEETRREFRKLVEKLKPETRERLVTEIMRQRLYEAREKTKDLSEKEKQAKVDEMVTKVKEGFSKLNPEQREKIKEDMNSEEGKKRLKKSIDFYYTEFTTEERTRLDPLVNEIMTGLNSL